MVGLCYSMAAERLNALISSESENRQEVCFLFPAYGIQFNMKGQYFFRAVSFLVLIAVVLMFAGLSTSVSAAIIEKSEKSCCDGCSKNGGQNTDHCSTPDCPVFLCLSVNTVSPFAPVALLGSVYIHQLVEELHLKSPVKSIFHPPTIS